MLMCNILGAFGVIYKGTWTHKAADSIEVTHQVALKTIKSEGRTKMI